MERVGEWLWRRHRRRFIRAVACTLAVVLSGTILVPAVTIGSVYLDLGIEGALGWVASTMVVVAALVPLVMMTTRRELDPIRRWCDGDTSDPRTTWVALLHLPGVIVRRLLVIAVPLEVALSVPHVLLMAEPGRAGFGGLVIAYVLVNAAALQLSATLLQVLVRPAAVDVGRLLDHAPARESARSTIRRRMVVITVAVGSLAGVLTPVAVLGSAVTERDYLEALIAGSLFAGYMAWLFDFAVFRPTLAPLRDALEGTIRVRRGDLSMPVPVSTVDELGDLVVALNQMQLGLRDRASLQAAFGSYVDPLLARRLMESGSSVFEGEELDVTVMFADVRSFTSFAEGVAPADAVAFLNRLFDVVVPVLHDHGGHANHYLGDGLLAVFGAPQALERHADAALSAAVEVQRRVRHEFGGELRLGIGVNTGPVIAGTVGGGGRHEFTVIGDTVNAAARVEQLTKETGDAILITEATRAALSAPRPRTIRRGEFEVRGKATKLALHAVNPFPRSTR